MPRVTNSVLILAVLLCSCSQKQEEPQGSIKESFLTVLAKVAPESSNTIFEPTDTLKAEFYDLFQHLCDEGEADFFLELTNQQHRFSQCVSVAGILQICSQSYGTRLEDEEMRAQTIEMLVQLANHDQANVKATAIWGIGQLRLFEGSKVLDEAVEDNRKCEICLPPYFSEDSGLSSSVNTMAKRALKELNRVVDENANIGMQSTPLSRRL